MIGTSNEYEVLTDPTGNRRYFPFEASPERSTVGFGPNGFREQGAKEFIKQVWAEAYARYLKGESYYLSEDTLLLAEKSQESAVINNPNVDLLCSYLDEENRLGTMRICKKDLIHILTREYNVEQKEAEHAANIWWKMPHPDWTRPEPTYISYVEHGWLPEGASTSQRCMTKILGRSVTMHSTKRLGQ